MTRIARHGLLLLALTGATPAFAQDWRVSSISGEKPDRAVYLIDAASIVHNGDTVDFTTESIFESLSGSRDFDRSVTKRHASCSAMSSQIVENNYYASGKFQSSDTTPGQMLTAKSGTLIYDVIEQACGKAVLQQDTVADPEAAVRAYFAK